MEVSDILEDAKKTIQTFHESNPTGAVVIR